MHHVSDFVFCIMIVPNIFKIITLVVIVILSQRTRYISHMNIFSPRKYIFFRHETAFMCKSVYVTVYASTHIYIYIIHISWHNYCISFNFTFCLTHQHHISTYQPLGPFTGHSTGWGTNNSMDQWWQATVHRRIFPKTRRWWRCADRNWHVISESVFLMVLFLM